jgi:hypothetical protein
VGGQRCRFTAVSGRKAMNPQDIAVLFFSTNAEGRPKAALGLHGEKRYWFAPELDPPAGELLAVACTGLSWK